ncbi:hypothetical protein Ancab_019871 [Ancistrocladus abbreviatus]
MQRLAMRLGKDDNTILHQVACMKFYHFGTKPNLALQLQEELQWFERVKRHMPIHYMMHHNKGALIATVVFAAAYIVPQGTANNGIPNFLHYCLFLVFTIMDIVSLTSSLTSLILFLSILTSPYQMQDFHMSIPRKLMFGFNFLFLSVATAMCCLWWGFSFSIVIVVGIVIVVFATAYTIPGGTTNNGIPNFLHYHLVLYFTVMDIISLTSSLISLILFLSTLTSLYHMQDFYMSIPQKLIFEFTLLFLSMTITTVALTITILLSIQLRK